MTAAFLFAGVLLAAGADRPPIELVDVTESAGIRFVHETGASGRRYMVETFGGGVLVLDYDGDGWPDLLFVNGGSLPGFAGEPPRHALYRNGGDGSFEDVTAAAGLEGTGYGMGGVAADADNDGDPDLYLTAFGRDLFYRNNGDGTFSEIAASAGLGDLRWSTAATFFDLDGDGLLDLFAANYLDFSVATHKRCTNPAKRIEAYCHPDEYGGVSDLLYRNIDGLSFIDRSVAAGLAGARDAKGLGAVTADYDRDGDLDLYVANDSTPNFLYRNEGGGRVAEVGFESGVALNEEGLAEAGMGVDWGDVDRDGFLDLIVTNFDFEKNTLYRNLGNGYFLDHTAAAGLGDRSMTELGFGCDLVDLDNDGWLDLILVNGHIQDNIAEIQSNLSYAQPAQLFRNEGGRFVDLSNDAGEALRRPRVGRGLATLDFDRDGDLDVAIANNGSRAELLRNDGEKGTWIALRLVGTSSNRDGIGARIEAEIGGKLWVEEVRAGSSYLAQNEMTVHVGLGRSELDRLTVRWPSGHLEEVSTLRPRSIHVIKEGLGLIAANGEERR